MADATSALQRIQGLFGVRGDGISGQTKRALIEEGVIETQGTAVVPVDAAPMVAGPQPSQELLDRVRKQEEQRASESFKRLMEQRRRQLGQ